MRVRRGRGPRARAALLAAATVIAGWWAPAPARAAGAIIDQAPPGLIERYVQQSDAVREARRQLAAADDAYQRLARVARRPTLSLSVSPGGYGNTPETEGESPLAAPVLSSRAGVTVSWSPLAWATLGASGTLSALDVTSGEWKQTIGLDGTLSLWPPPTDRSLDERQALIQLEQARGNLDRAEARARIDGQLQWVQLQVARARVSLARQEAESRAGELAGVMAQHASGLASSDDVEKARLDAQGAQADLQDAAAKAAALERSLAVLDQDADVLPEGDALVTAARAAYESTRSRADMWPLGEPDSTGVTGSVRGLPAVFRQGAVESDPDVTAARESLDIAHRRLDAAGRKVGDASVQAGLKVAPARAGGGWDTTWSVGLSLGLDLLDGGARALDIGAAERDVADAVLDLEDARRSAEQAVDEAWQSLASAALRLEVTRMRLDQADLARRSAAKRLSRGLIGERDRASAERTAWGAALDLIESAASLQAQQARLALLVGLDTGEVLR